MDKNKSDNSTINTNSTQENNSVSSTNDKSKEQSEENKISQQINQKKNKNNKYNSMFSYIIEVLTSDKPETDKNKSLILLEQDFQIVQDKGKIYNLFKVFEECFNQTEFSCTPILKGQILMTGTTLLILLNAKEEHNLIFVSFINNILIEHIKNTNNVSNLYLRQVACQCLEEIENEYPGILFSLMGRRTLEIFENYSLNGNNTENKSMKSASLSVNTRRNYSLITNNNNNEFQKIEYKKIELSNDGLYTLIEDEIFYVFQFYLSLFTTILKNMIEFYISQSNFINSEECKQFLMQKELATVNSLNKDLAKEDNISNNNKYIKLSKMLEILNSFNGNNTNNKYNTIINNNSEPIQSGIPFTNVNYQNLNMPSSNKDVILHINEASYSKYVFLNEGFRYFIKESNVNAIPLFNQEFLSYIHKAMSRIIHLLPKTTELIKAKIWKLLSYVISHIEVNQMALLPHFNYFHLNANSCILTLITMQIIESFPNDKVKKNFILKLIIKLCLLIKDQRLNKNLRILVIRWLINIRNSSTIQFDFNTYLQTIAYYLAPIPFDALDLCNEKIKSLFIFFENSNESEDGCNFIVNSISIMDNYKYYPIFSRHIKSLFRSYLFIIVRYPYKTIIQKLCVVLKTNLKEVPRILPNIINLFSIVKSLSLIEKDKENDDNKLSFENIYKCMLIEMSKFISSFNSYRKLNKYFELFLEISKNNSIPPTNIIKGLNNLYNSVKFLCNWKIEKNILEICKVLLTHHDLDVIKENNLQELLKELTQHSFDYGIREKAKLYYQLVTNVEKEILLQYLDNNYSKNNNRDINEFQITIHYDFEDQGDMSDYVNLLQSKEEREEAKLLDRGTAIYNNGCEGNILLLSECLNDENKKNYADYLYNNNGQSEHVINYEKVNDYLNKRELDEVINNLISSSDILRLFINDRDINDKEESSHISNKQIFKYAEGVSKNKNNLNANDDIDKYFMLISSIRFYIKLPISIQMKKTFNNSINKMYSISLCFGVIPSMEIISPILLPYIEVNDDKSNPYNYQIYLIIYPKVPIPSDIKTRIIFYDQNGKCCYGLLNNLKIVFEDFFLPITLPFKSENIQDEIKFKQKLFKRLWKTIKENKDGNSINTNRTFTLNKDSIMTIVKNKLLPFLIDQDIEDKYYIIENPYMTKHTEYPSNYIIKQNYDIKTGKYKKSSYDFFMDNFIQDSKDTDIFSPVKYNLAKVLIFIPEHYHLLFKIKISSYTSIVEIRSDCGEILEYIDDYFDSWIKKN